MNLNLPYLPIGIYTTNKDSYNALPNWTIFYEQHYRFCLAPLRTSLCACTATISAGGGIYGKTEWLAVIPFSMLYRTILRSPNYCECDTIHNIPQEESNQPNLLSWFVFWQICLFADLVICVSTNRQKPFLVVYVVVRSIHIETTQYI